MGTVIYKGRKKASTYAAFPVNQQRTKKSIRGRDVLKATSLCSVSVKSLFSPVHFFGVLGGGL